MFAALEAALVLELDANLRMPTVGLTTTTRREGYSLDDFKRAQQALWRQLRRELEPKGIKRTRETRRELIEYCGFIEWTTGITEYSHGVRRPHQHALVKGIHPDHEMLDPFPLAELDESHPLRRLQHLSDEQLQDRDTCELEKRVSELWFKYTGDAFIVEARPLRTPAGAIRYLALHNRKKIQGPPPGFRGRRLRPSKLYYEQPIAEMRKLARKLGSDRWIKRLVEDAIAGNLLHEQAESEMDHDLTTAVVRGLRSLAKEPAEAQYEVFSGHEKDPLAARGELVARTVAELKRIREQTKPELVYVRERADVDKDTGAVIWRATAVLGPVEPRMRKQILDNLDRNSAFVEAA